MRSSYPKKNRKFKLLTGDSVIDTTTVPHPPLASDKTQNETHSIPIQSGILDTDMSIRNSPKKHSLLDGCYDETESAESFKAALNEWRNEENETGTETMTSSTDISKKQTILSFPAFTTNNKLTYFDRLVLRKYKSEIPKSKSEENCEISGFERESLKSTISEYNIFYNADLNITELTNEVILDTTNSGTKCGSDMKLKIVTQTNLSGFFLLGTEVSNENKSQTNQNVDFYSTKITSISRGKFSWKPSESVTKNSYNYGSDSDSSTDSTLEDFVEKNDRNISEDEDMLALEELSNELATGGTGGLWTELMCHRPPTSSDFT